MKRRFSLTTILGYASAALLGFSLVFGIGYYRQLQAAPNYEYLDTFTKVLHFVQTNYVEEVDTKKLMEGAIKGMLGTLDPHTVYLPPDAFKEMQVDTSGQFGGLGIEITLQDGVLTVVTPIEDTPAFRAGVEPGDQIIRIVDKKQDIDKSTKGMSLHDAVKLMRGARGTSVTIHVVRKGLDKPEQFTITREIIKVASIKSGLVEPNYGWLRITSFQNNTTRDLRRAVEKLEKQNQKEHKAALDGVVLDLRNNPGGLLEEAVGVSGLFLEKVPVVSTKGRDPKRTGEVEVAKEKDPYLKFKMVVLVNEASASASEIVAGALQDHKRALIVGKRTFGKGSVQTVIDLDNKSGNRAGLKLTVARYYTPSGRSIQSEGIKPDIEVDRISPEAMKAAREQKTLREADLTGHLFGEHESSDEKSKDNAKTEDPRPVKEKDGKKVRIDDPKELVEQDFQLQQAVAYLKAWNVFQKVAENSDRTTINKASARK